MRVVGRWIGALREAYPDLSDVQALGVLGLDALSPDPEWTCGCGLNEVVAEIATASLHRYGISTESVSGESRVCLEVHPKAAPKIRYDDGWLHSVCSGVSQPPVAVWCIHRKRARWAVYGSWRWWDRASIQPLGGIPRASLKPIALFRTSLADSLQAAGGKGTNPAARRLLAAADVCRNSVQHLTSGEATNYSEMGSDTSHLLHEALLKRLLVPPGLQAILLDEPLSSVAGSRLAELIYLARAGRPELKLMAARRLSGARDIQAMSTLAQLLHSDDIAVARTAIWALRCSRPERLGGTLLHAVRTVSPKIDRSDVRLDLLLTLSDTDVAAARVAAEELVGERGLSSSGNVRRLCLDILGKAT